MKNLAIVVRRSSEDFRLYAWITRSDQGDIHLHSKAADFILENKAKKWKGNAGILNSGRNHETASSMKLAFIDKRLRTRNAPIHSFGCSAHNMTSKELPNYAPSDFDDALVIPLDVIKKHPNAQHLTLDLVAPASDFAQSNAYGVVVVEKVFKDSVPWIVASLREAPILSGQAVTMQIAKELMRRIGQEELFSCVILSHVYLEASINGLLSTALLEPKALGLDSMPFKRKLNLVVALGLIHADAERVFSKFSDIRNEFAHLQSPKIDAARERDLINVLRQFKPMRDCYRNTRDLRFTGIRLAIWTMWIYLFEQTCRLAGGLENLRAIWKLTVDASIERNSVQLGLELDLAQLIDDSRKVEGSEGSK